MELKQEFIDRLAKILANSYLERVKATFSMRAPVSARINALKTGPDELKEILRGLKVPFKTIPWSAQALVFPLLSSRELETTGLLADGRIYIQSLASMLPVALLDPQPEERVLDLCAAPGSKASQIAARMGNQGELVCVEPIRKRYYKLKSVLSRLGVANARLICADGRRFRDRELFDRILVDAPCSCEARFKIDDPKTRLFWSPRKIKEMARKQKGLVLNASRLLKKGGILIYSTCTFAPEENEAVADWLLRKTAGQMEMLDLTLAGIETYPAVTAWEGRAYDPRVSRCLRVLPTEEMEGFFIAGFRKGR